VGLRFCVTWGLQRRAWFGTERIAFSHRQRVARARGIRPVSKSAYGKEKDGRPEQYDRQGCVVVGVCTSWLATLISVRTDEHYLSFLETLKATAKTESVSLDTLSEWTSRRALNRSDCGPPSLLLLRRSVAASQPPPRPTTTPLLEALKAEKSAQKDKETILRNHAHYKDATATVSGSASKKEDAKKKAVVVAPVHAVKLPDPPTPSGKKGKKVAAAAQKAQDGQGALGKSPPAGGGAPSSAKTSVPALASSAGHAPRHRPPKEPHGRSHAGKGDSSAAPMSASGPASLAENATPGAPANGPVPAPSQRKNRPVIGLGRHFEAALNGAGVAVAPGPGPGSDRKRRDKGGESGAGAGPGLTEGGAGKGKKHREERQRPPEVVPSILQRPELGGPDVVVVQRSQSPRGTEGHGEAASAGGGGGGASVRGSARRGRGRGRGGHRGG
jgi:regulator of nonsense transcripts 3